MANTATRENQGMVVAGAVSADTAPASFMQRTPRQLLKLPPAQREAARVLLFLLANGRHAVKIEALAAEAHVGVSTAKRTVATLRRLGIIRGTGRWPQDLRRPLYEKCGPV